jgi:hypothetical protein
VVVVVINLSSDIVRDTSVLSKNAMFLNSADVGKARAVSKVYPP